MNLLKFCTIFRMGITLVYDDGLCVDWNLWMDVTELMCAFVFHFVIVRKSKILIMMTTIVVVGLMP